MRVEGHIDGKPGCDRRLDCGPAGSDGAPCEVIHRDAMRGRCVADIEDLEDAGIGDGRDGFKFALPIVLARSEIDQVGVTESWRRLG